MVEKVWVGRKGSRLGFRGKRRGWRGSKGLGRWSVARTRPFFRLLVIVNCLFIRCVFVLNPKLTLLYPDGYAW